MGMIWLPCRTVIESFKLSPSGGAVMALSRILERIRMMREESGTFLTAVEAKPPIWVLSTPAIAR
jgi:hypothetical protein